MLRRVRKEDVKVDSWVKPDAVDYCLECWTTMMHRNDTDLGIHGRNTLKGDGDGYGDEDASKQRRDNEVAAATHAVVHSLIAVERWAIYRKYGITTMWSFPSIDFLTAVEQALDSMDKKLRVNIATRNLF